MLLDAGAGSEMNERSLPPIAPETEQKFAGWWKDPARFSVLAIGSLYAIGLVIVNVDLGRYGLVHLSLARPEYVMAGGLWAVLVAGSVGAIQVLGPRLKRRYSSRKWHKWLQMAVDVFSFSVAVPYALLMALKAEMIWTQPYWKTLVLVLILPANALAILAAYDHFMKARRAVTPGLRFLYSADPTFPATMMIVVFAVGIYATMLFPQMPRYFGGGKKPVVWLMLSDSHQLEGIGIDLPRSKDGRSLGPVKLLLETESLFVVRTNEPLTIWPCCVDLKANPTVGVDRKLVSAVIYSEERESEPQRK